MTRIAFMSKYSGKYKLVVNEINLSMWRTFFHGKPLWLFSRLSVTEDGSKLELCRCNACTLVPTVFLQHRKTKFKLPVSFFVCPRRRKEEFKFLFSCFVFLLHWKRKCNFYFRFSFFFHYFVQQNCNCHFPFFILFSCGIENRNLTDSIFVSRFRFYYVISRQ